MNEIWYYVQTGERKGPVEISIVNGLISEGKLGVEDYVWKKGLENWIKIKDVEEFNESIEEELPSALPSVERIISNKLNELAQGKASIFIKIGMDRGVKDTEYGPYTVDVVKKLFISRRGGQASELSQLLATHHLFENLFFDDLFQN